MPFVRLQHRDVRALIRLIEELKEDGIELKPEEAAALDRLRLIQHAQELAKAASATSNTPAEETSK